MHTQNKRSTRGADVARDKRTKTRAPMTRVQKQLNAVLAVLLLVAVVFLGTSGYMYVNGKAQAKAASAEADAVLENRLIESDVTAESSGPTMLDMWKAKETFEKTGLKKGEAIGKLIIPKMKAELPIVEGVDPADLLKGVGHDHDTLLPLDNGQTVLSGHRDTVFKGIGVLEVGDTLTVSLPYGDFDYRITKTYIVDAKDRTVIVPHDSEILTVTTCYPFNFVGDAPDRYIINAEPMFDMQLLRAELAADEAYQAILGDDTNDVTEANDTP